MPNEIHYIYLNTHFDYLSTNLFMGLSFWSSIYTRSIYIYIYIFFHLSRNTPELVVCFVTTK